MKKISIALAMLVTLLVVKVHAADIVIDRTGWTKVGENEVQIYKLPIENAQVTYSDNSKFDLVTNTPYTDAEYAPGGKYDQERGSKLTYNGTTNNSRVIVYKNILSTGTHNNLGSFSLRWSNAAKLQDGTSCDVKITISVITLKIGKTYTKPLELLSNDSVKNLWLDIRYAKQEVPASSTSNDDWNAETHSLRWHEIGAKYDITYEIYRAGTDEKIENKNMVFKFEDLDQADKSSGYPGDFCSDGTADSSGSKKCPANSNGTPAAFTEGITLSYGASDKAYMDSDNQPWLNISSTSAGANTRFTAKQGADGANQDKAGFTTRFNSSNLKYTWTGSDCGTGIGHILSKKVVTSTSGQYPNNIHIDPTDNEVFWKEDKKINIVVDPGYKLSKVTADSTAVDLDTAVHETNCSSGTVDGSKCYYYTFNDVIVDHTIDVQATKQPYTLTVQHLKNGTTEELAPTTSETKYYGDSYTTEALTNLPAGYELVGTPSNATGTITDNTLVTYYYKLKDLTLTVHHYIEGTTTKLVPDVVSTKTYGTSYTTDWVDIANYEQASRSDNHAGTITQDTEVNYYYRKKQGTLTVHHYEEGTTNKLAPDVVSTLEYGDSYTTSASSLIPQNYTYSSTSGDSVNGTISKDNTVVNYYYQKKDGNIVPNITKAGTLKITSPNDTVSYKITYTAALTDIIGDGTVTIVDTLPYKIDATNSNLDGGTYDDNNKTITWTQNVSVNSYESNTLTIEKNISVKYLNIDTTKDQMENNVQGRIVLEGKDIPVTNTFITLIDVKGDIIVKYIDKETGDVLTPNIETTDKVGKTYSPEEKTFEGYTLVTRPEHTSYEYKITPQTLVYEYEKIKLNVVTRVNGEGGTIEGDEVVLYGNDSTKDKIKIKADGGFVISKITINGQEVSITENLESLTLSNFLKMTEDKLVEVSFKPKPIVVVVEKTASNTPLIITVIGIVFALTAIIVYLYKTGKFANIIKRFK